MSGARIRSVTFKPGHALDSLTNAITGQGTRSDWRRANVYHSRRLTEYEIASAYDGSGLMGKVIDIPALDKVRAWRDWQAEKDQITAIEAEEKRLGLRHYTHDQPNAVTAVKINAGAVETAKLAAGAVEADKIAANAVIAAKIQAGAVETAKLAAGAVTTDKIDAGAVTAAKINVTQLSAINARMGDLEIRPASSQDGRIRVFDESDNLRVLIGRLS